LAALPVAPYWLLLLSAVALPERNHQAHRRFPKVAPPTNLTGTGRRIHELRLAAILLLLEGIES
jgi:hypothetical protein